MTMARTELANNSLTRWYHCVSRGVRRAFLLSEGKTNRKQWVEGRLTGRPELSVGSFVSVHANAFGGRRSLKSGMHPIISSARREMSLAIGK
jgi:hypothetical protein